VSVAEPEAGARDRSWANVELEVVDEVFVKPRTRFGERLRLPRSWAYDAMSVGVPIVMTTDEIIMDGHLVAPLRDGKIAPEALDEYLIRDLEPLLKSALRASQGRTADPENRHAILFADARFQVGALIPLLYTAGVAGFASYDLAVDVGVAEDTELPVGVALPFTPPPVGAYDKALNAFIDRERVVLWLETMPEVLLNVRFDADSEDDVGHLALLAASRSQAAALQGAFPTLTFSAEQDVAVGRVVAVLSALRGPECDPGSLEDRSKCFFPVAVIEAGTVPPKADFGPALATVAQCRTIAARLGPKGVRKAGGVEPRGESLTAEGRLFFTLCVEAIHEPDVACFESAGNKVEFDRCTQHAVTRAFGSAGEPERVE
jgi:hypothetical protein